MAMYRCPKKTLREKCTLDLSIDFPVRFADVGYFDEFSFAKEVRQYSSHVIIVPTIEWYTNDPTGTMRMTSIPLSFEFAYWSEGSLWAEVIGDTPNDSSSNRTFSFPIELQAQDEDEGLFEPIYVVFKIQINCDSSGRFSSITRTEFQETTHLAGRAYAHVYASNRTGYGITITTNVRYS